MRRSVRLCFDARFAVVLLLLGVSVVLLFSRPAHATLFWDDNFSNGLLNWDLGGCQNGGNPPADPFYGCNPGVTGARYFSPSLSVKTTFHPTDPHIQQATYYNRTFPSTADVWTRIYMRHEGPGGVGPFVSDPIQVKHMIVYGNGPGLGAWLVYPWGSKTLSTYLVNYPTLDDSVNFYHGPTMNDYQWYCVEQHFNRGTQGQTNGQYEVFVDGVQYFNLTGVVFDNLPDVCPPGSTCQGQTIVRAFTGVRIFGQYGSGDRYFDDIAVGNTRIGCVPGQGGGGEPPPPPPPPPPPTVNIPNAPSNLIVN